MKVENSATKELLKNHLKENPESINNDFKDAIKDSLQKIENIRHQFTLESIKKISLDDIKEAFENDEDQQLAKNLKLATMFSNDETLTKVMYDTVLNKPQDLASYFLKDRYDDKFNFLTAKDENSLAELLHLSVTNKLQNKNSTDVIEKEKLDMILLQTKSFNFLSALTNTSKNQYDRYKDKNSDYSFLYNNYSLEYAKLTQKYKDLDDFNKNMLKSF